MSVSRLTALICTRKEPVNAARNQGPILPRRQPRFVENRQGDLGTSLVYPEPGDRRGSQSWAGRGAWFAGEIFNDTSLGQADLIGSGAAFSRSDAAGSRPALNCERRRSPGSDGASPYHNVTRDFSMFLVKTTLG